MLSNRVCNSLSGYVRLGGHCPETYMPPAFPSPARILVVDDQEDILLAARLLLKRHFRSVETLQDPGRLPDLVRANAFDVLLLDMNFAVGEEAGAEGLSWLSRVLAIDPQ